MICSATSVTFSSRKRKHRARWRFCPSSSAENVICWGCRGELVGNLILTMPEVLFLKPCFYSDASGQRSTKPYYISYKSNFVQNPIIAFVNQPLANTKKLPFCPQFHGQWFYIEYDMDVTDCTKTVPHATKIDVKECAALNNKRMIISPSCCTPSCASPWIRQRMPYWLTRGKLALCTRDLKPIDQLPYWKPETGNPS